MNGVDVVTSQRSEVAAFADSRERPNRPVGAVALMRSALVLAGALGLTWWLIPEVTGTSWSGVGALIFSLTGVQVAALAGLWALGLLLHTFVLTGSLPGLSHRRALTLNLTGSAVSNALPGGGAAGVATNLMMMRTWAIPSTAFASYTLVSNIWDVVAKASLPLIATGVLLALHLVLPRALLTGVAAAAVVLLMLFVVVVAVRRSTDNADERFVGAGGGLQGAFARATASMSRALPMAERTARTRWLQLTLAMSAYVFAQGALLWVCLRWLGADVTIPMVIAAFAVERVSTLIPITPAGTGLAEAGAVTVLVAMGANPAAAGAGVLLYRLFTVALEIPVGALWLAGWSHLSTWTRSARSLA